MALDFPNSPTYGQEFTPAGVGKTWVWDGTSWQLQANELPTPKNEAFIWNDYEVQTTPATSVDVGPANQTSVPIGEDAGVRVVPDGWSIDSGELLLVPPGIYTLNWYWESEEEGYLWDNYAYAFDFTPDLPGSSFYPTAVGGTDSWWGAASAVMRLYPSEYADGQAAIGFQYVNKGVGIQGIRSTINVMRLDG